MLIIQNPDSNMGSYDDAALGLNDTVSDLFYYIYRFVYDTVQEWS